MGHVVQPVDGLTEGKADLNFSRKLEVEEGPAGQETRAVAESLLTVPEEGPRLATPRHASPHHATPRHTMQGHMGKHQCPSEGWEWVG